MTWQTKSGTEYPSSWWSKLLTPLYWLSLLIAVAFERKLPIHVIVAARLLIFAVPGIWIIFWFTFYRRRALWWNARNLFALWNPSTGWEFWNPALCCLVTVYVGAFLSGPPFCAALAYGMLLTIFIISALWLSDRLWKNYLGQFHLIGKLSRRKPLTQEQLLHLFDQYDPACWAAHHNKAESDTRRAYAGICAVHRRWWKPRSSVMLSSMRNALPVILLRGQHASVTLWRRRGHALLAIGLVVLPCLAIDDYYIDSIPKELAKKGSFGYLVMPQMPREVPTYLMSRIADSRPTELEERALYNVMTNMYQQTNGDLSLQKEIINKPKALRALAYHGIKPDLESIAVWYRKHGQYAQ